MILAFWGVSGAAIHAKTLGHATVTQVNNDVRFKPTTGSERPAKPKDVVKAADTIRTGQKSQAELEFEDRTITRLGSNSSFSFDPDKREFQLHKGLLLFDMPKNAGGGKIITPAGTAAIEGTAGIVTYRSQPKVICLAGVINVLNPSGQLAARVMPGQLFIIGVTKYPVDFNLNGVKGGKLLNNGLPNNTEEFNSSTKEQQDKIQNGQLQATPFVVVGDKTDVLVAATGGGTGTGTGTGTGSTTEPPPGGDQPTPPPTPPPQPPPTPPPAVAEKKVTINVQSDQQDGGSCSGGGEYTVGSTATISATPLDGWTFLRWNDGSTESSRSVTVSSNGATYTAFFTKNDTPSNPWDGSITSADTINASTATLYDHTASPRYDSVTGTMNAGVATFDAGSKTVALTGDPTVETSGGQDAKIFFKTTGDFTATGVGGAGQVGSDTLLFHAEANNIIVQNSKIGIESNARGLGSIYFKAANNLTVDPSALIVDGYRAGTSTPLYDGGTIRLEAGHVINLSGTSWPTGRTELKAGGVNGGTVEVASNGSGSTDQVYLHHVGIDANASAAPVVVPTSGSSTPDPAPASAGARGGTVTIQSNARVQMEGTTLIQANGEVPGSISVAAGTATVPGVISLDAKDGLVALLASTVRVADDESFSLITPKQIAVRGDIPFGSATKTVQFSAPSGWAVFSAENDVSIKGTTLNVSASGSLNAGAVWAGKYNAYMETTERTHRFSARNVDILANASTGRGGAISIMADPDHPNLTQTQGISIGPNTDIQANSAGGGAGTITFSVEGGTTRSAQMGFSTEHHDDGGTLLQEGFVRMTAVNYTSVGSAPAPGNILIQGATFTDGTKSIKLIAHNTIGGKVNFNARESITVNDTLVDVDPTGPSALGVGMGYYDQVNHQGLATGRINLTGTFINGNSATGQGADLNLYAYDSVNLQHGTDIQLHGGAAAGYADIKALGRSSTPSSAGQITITATSQRGVRLSAQQTATVLAALAAGEVQVLGVSTGPSSKSINIWAVGPAGSGGCQISITAPQAIMLQQAFLDAASTASIGTISLTAKNITLIGALLQALGAGTSSPGGNISLVANADGTLSLTDSVLWAYGSGTGAGGKITLKGGTVNFYGNNNFNTGSTGDIYIYRDAGNAIPTSIIGNLHVLPYSSSFMITSADTLDGSTAQIINGGNVRFTGTMAGNVATFDFGNANVTVAGNPHVVPAASGTFNAEFTTQGALLLQNIPEDTSTGGPDANNSILAFSAGTININNSHFNISGTETGPDSMSFTATGNLLVDPSVLTAHSGPTDGNHTPGLIHLESTGGLVAFVGNGYDPTSDPSDTLRSHAQASVKSGSSAYTGGTVEFCSYGTHLVPSTFNPYDGVYVHDATLDVRPRDGSGTLISGIGGQVTLDGTLQVLIEDTTDIYADGATPGNVTIRSSGSSGLMAGLITLKVPNSKGHIGIVASTSGPPPLGGSINIAGMSMDGSYSINFLADGPAGGGTIRATAAGGYYAPSSWVNSYMGAGGIMIGSARFIADAPIESSFAAGQMLFEAPVINITDANLSAQSSGGTVGRIELAGKQPSGARLGTAVSLLGATLAVSGTEDPNGGIFINGDMVFIDPSSLANFSTGPAQVHIQSRQNTGGWSTSSSAPIYWSSLYFFMDDTTTINVSGTTPAINGTGGSLIGSFSAGVAVFDFGSQNVLLWPNSPHSVANVAGLFDAEFQSSGSFESLNMIPLTIGGPNTPPQTSRIKVCATGIQIINSVFNMGDNGALNGPSEFLLYSSTDALVLSPYDSLAYNTIIAPKTGMVGSDLTGGKFHMESAGVTAFVGNNSSRTSIVFVGAANAGGTVELVSTGYGESAGVYLRHAYIDTSHPLTSDYPTFTLSSVITTRGGTVTLDGAKQVSIMDTTDIYADGSSAAGTVQITSAGDSTQKGHISFHVEDNSTPGHIYISSQLTSSSVSAPSGSIKLFGAMLGDGSKTLNVCASGPAGGGIIEIEAPNTVFLGYAELDASAPSGEVPGGVIRLRAGASATTLPGTASLQTFTTDLRARGFDGGDVTTLPAGTGSFYLPANLEMHGTTVDVSSYGGTATGNTPQGGRVVLQGALNALISGDQYGSTDIVADGPETGGVAGVSAGSIQVLSPGNISQPGNVAITADATHFVRLSAQDSAVVFNALANGGNVEIHGADGRASGSETVRITASGPSGAGNITITAVQNLSVINAQLNASGALTLNGKNILVQNSLLTAALISIHATTRADILNSMLQASAINIHAPTVDFAGSTLSSQAQVYATTVVNPPASGTYTQHPYTP